MGTHPTFETVANEIQDNDPEKVIKPMTVIYTSGGADAVGLGVVLMGPIFVPCYEDGCSSQFSGVPLGIKNPREWQQTFKAYIVYDFIDSKYKIISANHQIHVFEEHSNNGYIPFDHGTGKLREVLGLIKYADELYGKNNQQTNFLKQLAENLLKN